MNNLLNSLILIFSCIVNLNYVHCHKHSDKPLLLLVSFDGFRWDYLNKHNLTNFNNLKSIGSHADFIYNSFSTVTFPNHWTLVTGLNEESHGILQNEMYDPILNKTFNYNDNTTQTIEWYGQNKQAEPIWTTNQKAGDNRYSAAAWVGANVVFDNQTIKYIPYNRSRSYKDLIDQYISLFTAESKPINFGALYFDEPDHTGHLYGPYSKEIELKLQELDKDLGYMVDQLKEHHLFDKINLILTSDHGMESISNATVIFLDDYIDTSLYKAYGSRSVYNVFVNNASDLDYVYEKFKTIPNIYVYKKNEIPEGLRYKNNVRVGEIIIVAKLGYAIYLKKIQIDWSLTNGDHGYYNNETSMFPMFIAHGPAFKKGHKTRNFNNVDLYPLMCLILGVTPAYNNGSIDNVLDLLEYTDVNTSFNLIFISLLLIPICLVALTGFFICLTSDSSRSLNEYGYASVSTSESTSILINEENGNTDSSRLIRT